MCKTTPEHKVAAPTSKSTEQGVHSPPLVTPSRTEGSEINHGLFDDSDNEDEVEVRTIGGVVDLISIDENLDDDGAGDDTLEEEWDTLMGQLTTSRAEVDRILQCLKERVQYNGRSENNSHKRNSNSELTGLFDGMASMRCAKRRRW